MVEYFDMATKTTFRQIVYGFVIVFAIALLMLAYLKTDRLISNGMIALGIVTVALGLVIAVDRAFVRKQLALLSRSVI